VSDTDLNAFPKCAPNVIEEDPRDLERSQATRRASREFRHSYAARSLERQNYLRDELRPSFPAIVEYQGVQTAPGVANFQRWLNEAYQERRS
jgi:hypothetical protein